MPDEKLDRIKQEINKVRKRELRMRLLKYGAVILVVILIVGYSMFWLMGHRISISGGDIVRTGSLQVGSTPAGASVSIDDKDQTYATPGQSVLDVGDHKIKLWIGTDGAYTDWQKNFTIGSDEVLWLDYATLLPTKPDTDTVANIGSSIAAINATRDAKWAVVQFGTFNQFAMLDISDPTNISVKDFSIPAASLTAADAGTAQTLKVVDTDNQSKYFLFEHDFTENGAAQHEYIYMAAADTLHAYNVTTTLNSDVTAMAFSQSSTGQFYGIDAKGNLLLLDYQKKTISAPLVRSVQSFTQFEDKITVVTVSGTGSAVGVYFNNSYTQLKVFSDNVHMPAYFARYDNTEYVAAYGDGKLCMINGPLTGPSETDVPLPDGTPALGWFNLNGNGRIIMMGSGQNVYVYDRVLQSVSTFTANSTPKFLDNMHIYWNGTDGSTVFADYDGDNWHQFLPANTNLFYSNDKKYMFSLASDGTKTVLERTNMTAVTQTSASSSGSSGSASSSGASSSASSSSESASSSDASSVPSSSDSSPATSADAN